MVRENFGDAPWHQRMSLITDGDDTCQNANAYVREGSTFAAQRSTRTAASRPFNCYSNVVNECLSDAASRCIIACFGLSSLLVLSKHAEVGWKFSSNHLVLGPTRRAQALQNKQSRSQDVTNYGNTCGNTRNSGLSGLLTSLRPSPRATVEGTKS